MNEKNRAERRNVMLGLGLMAIALAVVLFILTSYFSGVEEIMQTGVIPEDFGNVVVVVIMPWALCILYLFHTGIEGVMAFEKKAKWRLLLASISLALMIVLTVAGVSLLPAMPTIAGSCFTMLFVSEIVCCAATSVVCLK